MFRDREAGIWPAMQWELDFGSRPDVSIEVGERDSSPVQVVSSGLVAFDLDVHHDRIGLLNLSDLSQSYGIAESRCEICSIRVSAQVTRGDAGHYEEERGCADQHQQDERWRESDESKREMAMFLRIV